MSGEVPSGNKFDISKLEGGYDGTPGSIKNYYQERWRHILAGEPTWLVSSFGDREERESEDADPPPQTVYEFFVDNHPVAMVAPADESGYRVYVGDEEGTILGGQSVQLPEAVRLTEEHFGISESS